MDWAAYDTLHVGGLAVWLPPARVSRCRPCDGPHAVGHRRQSAKPRCVAGSDMQATHTRTVPRSGCTTAEDGHSRTEDSAQTGERDRELLHDRPTAGPIASPGGYFQDGALCSRTWFRNLLVDASPTAVPSIVFRPTIICCDRKTRSVMARPVPGAGPH